MFFDHYPYTNFHNVNLDWVLQAVKAWGQTVKANDQAFKDLKEANESFKAYVRNYLQDLDVSDEINTKLDRMLAEGTLTPYFAPYVKGYVESWLASNVTPTTPAVDKTLSISDAAADAAATGEKIVRASFLRTLDDPELYKVINKNHILPGYRIQSACHALGYFFVCGGSEAEDGTGFIAKMSDLDFKDAEITYIQGLGHANDITYSNTDHYLYITTVGEGIEWGIVKINPNDFTDRTLITNCPYNTIGIQYVAGWMYILAPYRIYRTLNFETYDLVIENTNDILNKFGIPERGSQTLVRVQDDILGWVGTYMSEPEHRWHGFIVYFGSDRPITFELFPTYNAECQAGVWDGHSVYFICNGTTSPAYTILKTDLLNLKYHLLGTGKDLNDYYGEGIYYLIGAATMDNCPVNNEGLTLHVGPQGLLNTRQDIYTNSGRHLYRIKLFNAGTWGEWVEQAAEIAQIKEDLSEYENIFTGNVDESVHNWLDVHPEATTTVQDGSITKEKLSEDMRASVDGSNINELALDSLPFMSVSENDSTAAQGLCAIDNRYVVIVKYKTDDTKAFSVYDFVTQTFVKESIFTDEQVGHCNTITYAEPYIYVATLNADKNIVRLAYDKQTHGITYDGVAYSGSEFNVKCVAYDHDKKLFYILSQTADTFALHATNDFASFTPQGQNNFQNFAYLSPQGLAASGEHVFITFSMSFRRTGADVMAEKVDLFNEVIYVTNKQMELLKTNEYPRGKYGEVEDCEIVTVNNQKYILIATNQTDEHVKCVYAKPVYKQTTFIEPFFETKILDALHSTTKMLNVYVDNSRTAPFAKGTKGNPYDSVETAVKNIRLLNVPTVLTISGTYTKPCVFRYIKNPLVIQLQNATLERIAIYGCNRIHFDNNTNSTLKQLYLDWSNVSIRTPLTIGPADGSDYTSGVVAYRSFLTGSFTRIDAYKYGIQSFSSIINAFVDDNQATTPVLKSTASLVCINGNIV